MFKWQKQEHTDISIIRKLDAKEKGEKQNLTQNVSPKNLNIEGKVDSYFLLSLFCFINDFKVACLDGLFFLNRSTIQ